MCTACSAANKQSLILKNNKDKCASNDLKTICNQTNTEQLKIYGGGFCF